jgi:hypothetical protein
LFTATFIASLGVRAVSITTQPRIFLAFILVGAISWFGIQAKLAFIPSQRVFITRLALVATLELVALLFHPLTHAGEVLSRTLRLITSTAHCIGVVLIW